MVMVSILSFCQNNGENIQEKLNMKNILCNCHAKFHYGTEYKKNNDTIVYLVPIKIYNDYNELLTVELHYEQINKNEINDSLPNIDSCFSNVREFCGLLNFSQKENKIAKTFKHGYINKWSWNTNSVNGIDFNIAYTNTNTKTIKYIDIYFIVKNPVGDICRISYNNGSNICHLKCVGPIEQFETGSYSWDAAYYTTGDASNLYFTKFVITYMDNTKYTLVKELAYKYYPFDNN